MASKIRVEVDREEVGKLLFCAGVASELMGIGQGIAARAGDGYSVTLRRDRDRVAVIVKPESEEAKRAEAEDHALLNALPPSTTQNFASNE